MKFHTEFDIKSPDRLITHQQKMLLMGSCFTENIGEKLRRHKFSIIDNPNGILFNPVSVAEAVSMYIENREITAAHVFELNESWHSWQHHSRFSGITAEDCVRKINHSTALAHVFLQQSDQLLITLGSAWVYMLTGKASKGIEGQVAANNHKAPADWFRRRLMSVDETLEILRAMLQKLFQFNRSLQVIFTISPVRHLREGIIDNNRSKAVLIQAVHELAQHNAAVYYFPAYELVIDDLRDYRFYAEDLVHPNHQATQYVWEKLCVACMAAETQTLMKEIAEINLACQHKPFNPGTEMHRHFLASYHAKTEALKSRHTGLDFSMELAYFAAGSV